MLTVTLTLPELPLTAEQFGELPDPEGFRLELADGEIVVMAAAQMIWHSNVPHRIKNLLDRQGRVTVRKVGVVVGKRDVPVPDVTVFKNVPMDWRRSQVPGGRRGLCHRGGLARVQDPWHAGQARKVCRSGHPGNVAGERGRR